MERNEKESSEASSTGFLNISKRSFGGSKIRLMKRNERMCAEGLFIAKFYYPLIKESPIFVS
ncbi:MAG: hypothetical protein J7L96_02685 [Bacteroidales bacterium]|nr:hypothetical protein [Bacteroidales bacterium]